MSDRHYRVTALPGDGIGPEVVAEAREVLDAAGDVHGFEIEWTECLVGGAAIDVYGVPLRAVDLETCRASDAVLLGAVGGPAWSDPSAPIRPEQALFALRGGLELFANLRPVSVHPSLAGASPLRRRLRAAPRTIRMRADHRPSRGCRAPSCPAERPSSR